MYALKRDRPREYCCFRTSLCRSHYLVYIPIHYIKCPCGVVKEVSFIQESTNHNIFFSVNLPVTALILEKWAYYLLLL